MAGLFRHGTLEPDYDCRKCGPTGFHDAASLHPAGYAPTRAIISCCAGAGPLALNCCSAASLAAIADTGSLAELMFERTVYGYGARPSSSERRAWARSIPVLADDLMHAGLGDVEVLLEHRLPLSSGRVDAILVGRHPRTGSPSYVVIRELKQWSGADIYEDDPALVTVDGLGPRPRLHPLEQVRRYCEYLVDSCPRLQGDVDAMSGVAYVHNATEYSVATASAVP